MNTKYEFVPGDEKVIAPGCTVKLYPGISIGLTTAGDALPLGERHKLYDATAIAQARVQALEEAAKVCESTVWSADIDVWRDMTKKDVSVKSMLACADAIRALGGLK